MAVTVSTQKITTLGPIKMEVVNLTTLTSGDTFTTLIQNPQFAVTSEYGTAAAGTATASISGRTVTVNNLTTGGGTGKACVLVFGF